MEQIKKDVEKWLKILQKEMKEHPKWIADDVNKVMDLSRKQRALSKIKTYIETHPVWAKESYEDFLNKYPEYKEKNKAEKAIKTNGKGKILPEVKKGKTQPKKH